MTRPSSMPSGHQPLSATPEAVSLARKFGRFSDYWSPKIVSELNGQMVKLVKFRGAFEWHHHLHEDELFLVHRGTFRMECERTRAVLDRL